MATDLFARTATALMEYAGSLLRRQRDMKDAELRQATSKTVEQLQACLDEMKSAKRADWLARVNALASVDVDLNLGIIIQSDVETADDAHALEERAAQLATTLSDLRDVIVKKEARESLLD